MFNELTSVIFTFVFYIFFSGITTATLQYSFVQFRNKSFWYYFILTFLFYAGSAFIILCLCKPEAVNYFSKFF